MKGAILHEYMEGVVERGAEAVLPQHLEQRWLELLLDEAQRLKDGEAGDCAGMFASVMEILSHQNHEVWERVGKMEVEPERLFKWMYGYAMYISLEVVSRQKNIQSEQPTLEDIFDVNRKINLSRFGL